MCINPRQYVKKLPDGSSKIIEFPCGKCSQCVSAKHSQFAMEAALEARVAKSVHLVTLTYRNDSVPIMVRRVYTEEGREYLQERYFLHGKAHQNAVRACQIKMDGSKGLGCTSVKLGTYDAPNLDTFNSFYATPSLHREDVRLFLKKCRIQFERQYGRKMDFRYALFGEYGDATNRPHYHGLFYDLDNEEAAFLRDRWSRDFGFCSFDSLPVFNGDGSPARIKAANYVSKYIAKNHKYEAIDRALVEAPRRFCSRGFGTKCLTTSDIQTFKNFTDAKI